MSSVWIPPDSGRLLHFNIPMAQNVGGGGHPLSPLFAKFSQIESYRVGCFREEDIH